MVCIIVVGVICAQCVVSGRELQWWLCFYSHWFVAVLWGLSVDAMEDGVVISLHRTAPSALSDMCCLCCAAPFYGYVCARDEASYSVPSYHLSHMLTPHWCVLWWRGQSTSRGLRSASILEDVRITDPHEVAWPADDALSDDVGPSSDHS